MTIDTTESTTPRDQPVVDDDDVRLILPEHDVAAPELSIVIPALNEELTIEEFISWCHEGIAAAGIVAEILIVDSGTDRTTEIAVANGARVLKTPKRGLGRAYLDAVPYARGEFLMLGDCDCTYDFRELAPFVEAFRNGSEYVMGSRFKGSIEPGSMPFLHRRLGTPVTTWILNRVYSSHFSDIHCGMRGVTKDAFLRMDIRSESWEYASEMVLKSVRLNLKTTEVPVSFFKDQDGRLSHHKRSGWTSPWKAAWINLRAMFVYGADFFLFRPGISVTLVGLIISVALLGGPVTIGGLTFSIYWMLLGVTITLVGLQSFYLGCLAHVIYDPDGRDTAKWLNRFRYTRTTLIAAAMFLAGIGFAIPLAVRWITDDFTLPSLLSPMNYLAIFGLLLTIASFMTFTFTLVLHALAGRLGVRATAV